MTFDQAIATSDFLNVLVYDLTTGDKGIMKRVSNAIQKIEDNDFPNADMYGIPKVLGKPVKDLIALQGWYINNPTEDNAVTVAEEILELFIAADVYVNSF